MRPVQADEDQVWEGCHSVNESWWKAELRALKISSQGEQWVTKYLLSYAMKLKPAEQTDNLHSNFQFSKLNKSVYIVVMDVYVR